MIRIPTTIPYVSLVVLDGDDKARLWMEGGAFACSNSRFDLQDRIDAELGRVNWHEPTHRIDEDVIHYPFVRPRGLFVKPEDRPEPSFGYYNPNYEPLWNTESLMRLYEKLKI